MIKLIANSINLYLEAHGYEIARHEHVEQHLDAERRDLVLADLGATIARHVRLATPAPRIPSLLELVCTAVNVLQTAAQRADVAQRVRLMAIAQALSAEVRTAAGLPAVPAPAAVLS